MFHSSYKERLTLCEVRLDELKECMAQSNDVMRELAKAALNLVDKQLNNRSKLEDEIDAIKAKLDLTIRAQCATYSAALERVQAMIEFEKKHGSHKL